MKRLLAVLIAITLLGLVGCGNGGSPVEISDVQTENNTVITVHTTESTTDFPWAEHGMIPPTPLNPIKTLGEVPEEYKEGLSAEEPLQHGSYAFLTDSGDTLTINDYQVDMREQKDIFLSLSGADGKEKKAVTYGGSGIDWIRFAAYVSGQGLVVVIDTHSKDGDFASNGRGSVLGLVGDDLKIQWTAQLDFYPAMLAGDSGIYLLDVKQHNYYKFNYEGRQDFKFQVSEKETTVSFVGDTAWGQVLQVQYSQTDTYGMNLISDIVVYQGKNELLRFRFDGGKAESAVADGDTLVIESIYIAGRFAMAIQRSSVPHARERVVSGYDRNGKLLWCGAEQLWYTDENGQAFESPPIQQ